VPLYSGPSSFTAQAVTLARDDPAHPDDITTVTDADGKISRYAYDGPTGDLVSTTDPLGNLATFSYDAIGRTVSSVAPKGNLAGANVDPSGLAGFKIGPVKVGDGCPSRAPDAGLRPGPFPDRAASLLPGPLAVTRTGLAPAGDDELQIESSHVFIDT